MPLTHLLGFPFFNTHQHRLKISLTLQSAVFLLALFLLRDSSTADGPNPFQFFLLTATAYWISVGIIMIRRNGHPTRLDQFLLAWGYPLMIVLTSLVICVVPLGLLRRH